MERTVGVRKLRDELTRHLGLVRRAGRITITDRGKPIALLLPYPKDGEVERQERLRSVLSSDHVTSAERRFMREPPLVKGRGPLPSRLISEGRR